ncbi:hypothetical protein RN001_010487 [Aquatica leii]|uniref:Uncharacterized protein n=1 Tax=Aquatica leii TaxID=1421715 RepID=A0AAN7S8L5_9COLE|nr:hypothetical protein RN001_010487 [Aquatica leii]
MPSLDETSVDKDVFTETVNDTQASQTIENPVEPVQNRSSWRPPIKRQRHNDNIIQMMEMRSKERQEIVSSLQAKEDDMDLFFKSIALSVKKLRPDLINDAKLKSLQMVFQLEVRNKQLTGLPHISRDPNTSSSMCASIPPNSNSLRNRTISLRMADPSNSEVPTVSRTSHEFESEFQPPVRPFSPNIIVNKSLSFPTDLLSVLQNFPNGNYVIHVFNKDKKLNDAARKILVDAIVAWHIERKIKISRDYFEKVSIVIEKQFNDDKYIYFKKRGLKPSVTIPILTDEIESEECENLAAWLRVNSEPWTDVQTHWKNTFKKRRREILLNFSLDNWPLFKHSQGFNLIDLDFYEIYEEKSYGLFRKWPNYKNKIINTLNAKIKDKQNLKLLKYLNTINSSEAISDTIIALLIHALLPPSVKYISKENNKKIILKSTIKDSQDSMFLHVKTLNDFDNRVEHLKNHLTERNESLQPIIVVVGIDLLTITNYYVIYDQVKYKFQNCLSAIDACFKIFHVLNLKYPVSSINTWTFFQKYFYEIHLSEDDLIYYVYLLT